MAPTYSWGRRATQSQVQALIAADELLRDIPECHLTEQDIDQLLGSAGLNPNAVRHFVRTLIQQEHPLQPPPPNLDGQTEWALRYFRTCLRDLFAAGGEYRAIMTAAQLLGSFVDQDRAALVKVETNERGQSQAHPGNNGCSHRGHAGEQERNPARDGAGG